MIGKIILWILLAFLAVLVLALLIPVKVRFSYDQGDLALAVRYGPVKIRLFPPKEEEKKEKPPKKKKEGEKEGKKEKKEKPPKEKKKGKINSDQILYALETLPPILGRALRRTGRSIHIRPLKAHVLVAGLDPADTALLYGRLEAAVCGGLPVLKRVMRVKEEDIRLYLDFSGERMDAIVDVGVTLRPGSLVWIMLRAGGSLLKWYLAFQKLASPAPEKEEKDNKENTEHEAA